ncbi:MAG: hypothetical protein LBT97_10390 [Planctomycetota bacterium]|nr:hypothetical protein [Planctomycetota bacterium]
MITSLVNRLYSRVALFALCVVLLLAWLLYGNSALQDLGERNSGTRRYVEKQVERLKRSNPAAGAALAGIARERDIHAVAAALRVYDRETGGNPVHSLARDLERNRGEGLRWYTLSAVGIDNYAQAPAHERDGFLNAYGAVYQNLLELDPSGAMTDDYAAALAAAKDDRNWRAMADDPSALVFRRLLEDAPEAWEYYARERDWLDAILVSLPVPEEDATQYPQTVLDAIRTARRYDPAFKKAYRSRLGNDPEADPMLGVALLELFGEYGGFLLAGEKAGLPAEEMADILYANRSEFMFSEEESSRDRETRNSIARMLTIRANKPNVWRNAPEEMNILWLERVAPEQAEYIAGAYGGGDVPTLLLAYYENEAPAAARAIVAYGDLGLYMLSRYRDDEIFKRHLASERVGIRVIPFITRFPGDGFASLERDTRWVDKYFNPDGSERDQGWIKDIPLIGGPANVVGNWLNRVPNTWGELGWAAFDVVDCALIVASFGSSTAAAQGVKQTGKQALKTTVRKTAAKSVLGAVAKTTARRGALSAAKAAGKATLSLLVRIAKAGYQSIRWGARATISAGRQVWTVWRSIPPPARKLITGLLATAMFCYSYDRRNTPEAIKKGMEALGRQVGKTINAGGAGAAAGITQAVNETLGGMGGSLSPTGRRWVWIGGLAFLIVAAGAIRPSRRNLAAFAKGV